MWDKIFLNGSPQVYWALTSRFLYAQGLAIDGRLPRQFNTANREKDCAKNLATFLPNANRGMIRLRLIGPGGDQTSLF